MEYLAVVVVGLAALWVVARFVELERADRLAALRIRLVEAPAAAPAPPLPPHTYSPHLTYQVHGAPAPALPAPSALPETPPALPGVTTLGAVLDTGWRPSFAGILLALGPGGTPYLAGVGDDLCHIILCGATGTGKTNLLRLLLAQVLAIGCQVYLLNPKHTDRHWRTGEEWGALAAATTPGRAITDVGEIGRILRWAAERELPARQARFQRGERPGVPLFLVLDEWPAIVARDPALAGVLADLLRRGREYLIEILTASQDVLLDTVGGTSGDRAQFQTRYYGGGDPTSKRALMTPQPRGGLPEPPGRGLVYLWAVPTGRQPALVRVPLVDNADIARLLRSGRSGAGAPLEGQWQAVAEPEMPTSAHFAPPSAPEGAGIDRATQVRVLRALRDGQKIRAIIEDLCGCQGGDAYVRAAETVRAILADLARAAQKE